MEIRWYRGAMNDPFTYQSDPVRIVFGAGAIASLHAEAEFHKMSRLMVLTSKSRADFARRVTAAIADRTVGFCDASAPNMPHEAFERVLADLKKCNADGFVVVGGGSPVGLAKAAAVATKIPYIAVVTTYSGSEMAARWNVGVAERRIGGDDRAALPATAIYDPELTLDLPPRISAASGMNAVAHAVESLYGIDTNPVVQACRGWCKIRATLRRAPTPFTAPGSPRISAPPSGLSTPWRSACGNGSISITPTLTPSPRLMRSASMPPPRRTR
jgi:maleylacetate reductase